MITTTKQTYQIFWQHVKKYKTRAGVLIFTVTVASLLQLVVPLYYRNFFTILANNQNLADRADALPALIHTILIILALNGIIWIFWRISAFSNALFQARIIGDIYNTCFSYLQNHSYAFFANRFVGSLVRRVGRLADAFENVADRLYWEFFPLMLEIVATIAILGYFNKMAALILFFWSALYIAAIWRFNAYALPYEEKRAQINSELTGELADTLTGNINVKLFNAFGYEVKKFKALTKKQFEITMHSWNLHTTSEALQSALMALLEFFIFYAALQFWKQGTLQIGDFVLIQAYILQLFGRLWSLGRGIRMTYNSLANAKEMVEILNTPHEIQDKPLAKKLRVTEGAVELAHVDFSYHETRNVIHDLSLPIKPGEKIGLVGPSGSGKTTLAMLLLRLFDLQGGEICIDGQSISDCTQDSLHREISFVPQDPILFHRTLFENIQYGRQNASREEVFEAAKNAYCEDFIDVLPEKYETYVGERGIKLSGGQRQRIAIARAFLKNAPILVLDEATSSLDSHSEGIIQQALDKLMHERTTIVIAHRLSTIRKMDRIIVLKDGRIVDQGTHNELIAKPDSLYANLWNLQVGGFLKDEEEDE